MLSVLLPRALAFFASNIHKFVLCYAGVGCLTGLMTSCLLPIIPIIHFLMGNIVWKISFTCTLFVIIFQKECCLNYWESYDFMHCYNICYIRQKLGTCIFNSVQTSMRIGSLALSLQQRSVSLLIYKQNTAFDRSWCQFRLTYLLCYFLRIPFWQFVRNTNYSWSIELN